MALTFLVSPFLPEAVIIHKRLMKRTHGLAAQCWTRFVLAGSRAGLAAQAVGAMVENCIETFARSLCWPVLPTLALRIEPSRVRGASAQSGPGCSST
jgi:hypothetical protein